MVELRKSFRRRQTKAPAIHSRTLPGDERIHESIFVDKPVSTAPDESVKTVYDCLLRGQRVSSNGDFLGERKADGKFEFQSYGTVIQNAQHVGSALLSLGLEAGQESRVAIAGQHSIEYLTAAYGLISYSMVVVPLYHNYKFDDLKTIVNKCRCEAMFCDTMARARDFIAVAAQETPTLKHIIILKPNPEDPIPENDGNGISVFGWNDFVQMGRQNPQSLRPPRTDDAYVICFTSGTTGAPKGAVISHRAMVATTTGPMIQWFNEKSSMKLTPKDTFMSFLSPAHVYEQIMETVTAYNGGRVGIFSGNVAKILDDMQELRPTYVAFVPRLLSKFKNAIDASMRSKNPAIRKLFDMAVRAKTRELQRGIVRHDTLWDRFVFNRIRQMVGGRLKFIVTGGAAIAPEVKYFSRFAYGCILYEGYGQTESAAAATLTVPNDTTNGHVGAPAPWCQVKLESVPEFGYHSEKDRGEICLRGEGLMDGYFEQPELTAETIDADGWLHTGDIGEWLPNGSLRIIDRKKHFFKLSQGDYVAPENVEAVYATSPLVSQIFVDGRMTEPHLIAVMVPDPKQLREMVRESETLRTMFTGDELAPVLQSEAVRREILNHLRSVGKQRGLSSIEQIRNLHLEPTEWSTDNGLLTPTLKMKRPQMRSKYATVIDHLYKEALI